MKERLVTRWQTVPRHIRRPIVLTIGLFFVLLSGSIGWLPGPGGIPIFLLGIAILSSEFHWAERLKQYILGHIHAAGTWMRMHKAFSSIILLGGALISTTILYMLFIIK
ncbi:MAG: PGPGW domain-containing protein [Candidatus Saccharimonadales bacterium]